MHLDVILLCSALGQHEVAIRFHKHELQISREVCDRPAESVTHGNLAVCYQALGLSDRAREHFLQHLELSRGLRDPGDEARALANLGGFLCSVGELNEARGALEQLLALTQELNDSEGELKACLRLGHTLYQLGKWREALHYYTQAREMAKEKPAVLCRAYTHIGLVYIGMGDLKEALAAHKELLQVSSTYTRPL